MIDPDTLTLYQTVLLEDYPSSHPVFSCLMGATERAQALAAGEIEDDGILFALLARLGPACPGVDAASAAVLHAAERVASRADAARDPDEAKDLRGLSAALRMIAIDLWRADTEHGLPGRKANLFNRR